MQRPNPDALRRLPLRAIVAYAARSARRVRPFYRARGDRPGGESYERAVDRAIEFAERFARGDVAIDAGAHAEEVIRRAYESANVAGVDGEAQTAAAHAAAAARSASSAMDHNPEAVVIAATANDDVVISTAESGIAKSLDPEIDGRIDGHRAAYYRVAADDVAGRVADIKKLLDLDLGAYPDWGRPIDISGAGPLGPLWPRGEPDWSRLRAPGPS